MGDYVREVIIPIVMGMALFMLTGVIAMGVALLTL